ALRIDDPPELPILGVIGLLEDVASLGAKRLEERGEVIDAVIDHERRLARRELVSPGGSDQPGRGSLDGVAAGVRPSERGPAPVWNVDAEMGLVPGAECGRILRVKEDASDSRDSLHQRSSRISGRCTAYRLPAPARSTRASPLQHLQVSSIVTRPQADVRRGRSA